MLAQKYRPQSFDEVIGQDVTVRILQNQIKDKNYSHSMLFTGNAGCGKTTCARIFANQIDGEIHELDCASHNGVADIKEIIDKARVKSLVHEYKVFILDECHTLSSAAWPALLITLEENLPHTFNFLPISETLIEEQLKKICSIEKLSIDDISIELIAKISKGSLRQSLTNLDKCISYGDLIKDNTLKVLNIVDVNVLDNLTEAINKKDIKTIIDLVNDIYNNGYELHNFVKQYLDYAVSTHNVSLMELLVNLIPEIRYDETPKSIIIARFITK